VRIIITNAAIASISSPGVSGFLTPIEAIARALEGSSVTSRISGTNTVSVEIRILSESVDVAGAAPEPRPSSPKYAQPLIEVPPMIEVIPREVMDAQGVTTLSEV
jgi:outer membrane receptor for monomeric catechols